MTDHVFLPPQLTSHPGFWRRAIAFLIDGFVIGIASTIACLIISAAGVHSIFASDKEAQPKWYTKDGIDMSLVKVAAAQGNVVAQVVLAASYQTGSNGVEKSPSESFEWYKKAAEQGEPTSQVRVAASYYQGDGVAQNMQEAVNWLTRCSMNTNTGLFTDEKGRTYQDIAKGYLNDPQTYPYRAKAMAAQIAEKQAKDVSDPDAAKFSELPTLTIIKLAQGNSSVSMQNDMSVITGALMQGIAQVKIKEIKRGQPLESLVSLQIPTGTKVYPIRIVSSGQGMDQTQDFYFYKDSFGDWADVPKPTN
jgi:hypothetical protein